MEESSENQLDPRRLAAARERGREAASAFDDGLRRREAEERRALLDAVDEVSTCADVSFGHAGASVGGRATLARMQAEIDHLRRFERAVLRSRVWRAAQGLRRLLGRQW